MASREAVEAAYLEYRASDLDGRALVGAMLDAAERADGSRRSDLAEAWSAWLGLALDSNLRDGTPLLEAVLADRPDLRGRLDRALRTPGAPRVPTAVVAGRPRRMPPGDDPRAGEEIPAADVLLEGGGPVLRVAAAVAIALLVALVVVLVATR